VKAWHLVVAAIVPAGTLGLLAACGSFGENDAAGPAPGLVESGADEATVADGSTTDAPVSDGAPTSDAGPASCAQRGAAALMCADFEDMPTPLVYANGTGSPVPPASKRQVKAPGKSSPNALWFDARTATVPVLSVSGQKTVTGVHVVLDFNIEAYGAGVSGGALVRVGVSPNTCYVDVALEATGLIVQTHCVYTDDANDWYAFKPIVGLPAPGGWKHLVLDVDYGGSQATVTLDGVETQLGLNPSAKPGGIPKVDIGESLAGVSVGFDDIVATTSN
jgi:hypothetical protein